MPLEKSLESIGESDLRALIENQVSERKTIEYKRSLHGNSDGEIKEFLADVSSFANAIGGDLIYGMEAEAGVPTELPGLEIANVDAEILRLESSIRDGVDPRIPGIRSWPVKLQNSRAAIILRIPKSWSTHMVRFKGSSRFFSRTSNGKYQLDVREIRAAFLMRESIADRIRDFRAD